MNVFSPIPLLSLFICIAGFNFSIRTWSMVFSNVKEQLITTLRILQSHICNERISHQICLHSQRLWNEVLKRNVQSNLSCVQKT